MNVEATFDLSKDQAKAQDLACNWYKEFRDQYGVPDMDEGEFDLSKDTGNAAPVKPLDHQIFRLFGYAGTGKTTTIRAIIQALNIGGSVGFAAFTGKAALVMKKQGLPARTIHSLIYKVVEPNKKLCADLYQKVHKEGRKDLQTELEKAQKVSFVFNRESEVRDLDLLVLDECSMVNDEMLNDLLRFRVPIMVLGDPGQLPPIEGTGALIRDEPDVILAEIHRQAGDSPIINFATRARSGIAIPRVLDGAAQCYELPVMSDIVPVIEKYNPQVLCGKNATRRKLNQFLRPGEGMFPVKGEKLICLRNDSANELFNGMFAEVVEVGEIFDAAIELTIQTELDGASPQKVRALSAHFEAYDRPKALEEVKWWQRTDTQEFDFGYAITVHKAQGSQWNNVLLVDDKFYVWDKPMRKRWLYTAITRAAENLTLISRGK
tara:strand:- start:620 stop:1921 length:1302 start_codon:yes stop_codon:yes gene_type:complete